MQSFGLRFKPWADYAEALRSDMSRRSKTPIDFLDHTLLTARVDDDSALAPFVDYLVGPLLRPGRRKHLSASIVRDGLK